MDATGSKEMVRACKERAAISTARLRTTARRCALPTWRGNQSTNEKRLTRFEKKFTVSNYWPASEVSIRADGSLDLADEILNQLDIVIAAVHSKLEQARAR